MFDFTITAQDGLARTGEFTTPHGTLKTPVFMPVGTHGAVKGVSSSELTTIGSQIILANTYHMYLRPGDELVKKLGGLHEFMQWNGPILTDSGGFQVFSLGEKSISGKDRQPLRKISEEGITFQSHIDGSRHFFSPEKSIEIQQNLGADIIMAFDQPVYGLSTYEATKDAVECTHRWLARSKEQWQKGNTEKQALFGIVQGGTHKELHTQSAEFVVSQNLSGNAIGGLAVGEDKKDMWEATSSITSLLPIEKPRYFMGLGDPTDILEASRRGVDMYDCVAPTRLARHGAVWQPEGESEAIEAFWKADLPALLGKKLTFGRLNLHNAQFRDDSRPLIETHSPLPTDLQGYSRAALHHYLKENEMVGYRVLSLHNMAILHTITDLMRQAIQTGKFNDLLAVFNLL
jgi:queuine tRNA-ribosyltransferase